MPSATAVTSASRWFFMGDAATPLLEGCAASCSLDCDVWTGRVKCGATEWSVYGGFDATAGMQLDQREAHLEGRQVLQGGASLRWGTAPDGRFCATVNRQHWNWEACVAEGRSQRDAVLGFARGYTQTFPSERVIACGNTGC
jgi:hypothetical protein